MEHFTACETCGALTTQAADEDGIERCRACAGRSDSPLIDWLCLALILGALWGALVFLP